MKLERWQKQIAVARQIAEMFANSVDGLQIAEVAGDRAERVVRRGGAVLYIFGDGSAIYIAPDGAIDVMAQHQGRWVSVDDDGPIPNGWTFDE